VGDFAISAPEFDTEGGDLSDVIESDPLLSKEGSAAEDNDFSGTIEIEAQPAIPPSRGAPQGSGLLDILESNAQQPPVPPEDDGGGEGDVFSGAIGIENLPAENNAPTEGSDLIEMPNIISTNLLDTSPDDFGPEILLNENLDGLSALGTELLSNPKFINAVAKAVAKNLDRQGHKF
jgi:hypothetical protein